MDVQMDVRVYGFIDAWTHGWMHGWMDLPHPSAHPRTTPACPAPTPPWHHRRGRGHEAAECQQIGTDPRAQREPAWMHGWMHAHMHTVIMHTRV